MLMLVTATVLAHASPNDSSVLGGCVVEADLNPSAKQLVCGIGVLRVIPTNPNILEFLTPSVGNGIAGEPAQALAWTHDGAEHGGHVSFRPSTADVNVPDGAASWSIGLAETATMLNCTLMAISDAHWEERGKEWCETAFAEVVQFPERLDSPPEVATPFVGTWRAAEGELTLAADGSFRATGLVPMSADVSLRTPLDGSGRGALTRHYPTLTLSFDQVGGEPSKLSSTLFLNVPDQLWSPKQRLLRVP